MKTKVIGLTGQTGAGKTTVSQMLSAKGYSIIDADIVAKQVLETSLSCLMDLVLEFSTSIIHPDGTLNREKLASVVFIDKQKLKRLNAITHPYIMEEIKERIEQYAAEKTEVVILDAPTLFEAGANKYCDKVLAMIAPQEKRLDRIIRRDGLSVEDAQNRINAQHDDEYYASRSDAVLVNEGDLKILREQLFSVLEELLLEDAADSAKEPPQTAQPIRKETLAERVK